MPDKDLKLNSLSRFSKQSSRFILEIYSGCEVPAGCGGVVLRWRSPDEPISMYTDYFSNNGNLETDGLDGEYNLRFIPLRVPYGSHIISFKFKDIDPSFAVVLLVMKAQDDYIRLLQPEGDTSVLSLPDRTWKFSLGPVETVEWQKPGFNDSTWFPMVEKPVNTIPSPGVIRSWVNIPDDPFRDWVERLTDKGAVGLGVDTSHPKVAQMLNNLPGQNSTIPNIYIRKAFSIQKKATQE
jgi:hypothetical protein